MEVKEGITKGCYQEQTNIKSENIFPALAFLNIKKEHSNVYHKRSEILSIKNEPEDEYGETSVITFSFKKDNISEVHAEDYYINAKDFMEIKPKPLERKILKEEYELENIKFKPHLFYENLQNRHIKKSSKSTKTIVTKSSTRKKYPCPICHKSFIKVKNEKRHFNSHFGKLTIPCQFCGQFYSTKSDFFIHGTNHFVKTKRSKSAVHKGFFNCDQCLQSFKTKRQLQTHYRIHTRPFSCHLCFKNFAHRGQLAHHINIHSGVKPFQCGICSKRYTSQIILKRHLDDHSDVRPFCCTICSKTFARLDRCNTHMRYHSVDKKYKCTECPKAFSQKYTLNRHLQVHEGKMFKCNTCYQEFTRKSSLNIHLKLHTGDLQFKCTVCSKKFTTKAGLKEHILLHNVVKPYNCLLCSKTFVRQDKYNIHLKYHEEGRQVKCDKCSKTFYDQRALKSHLMVHAPKTFKCNFCDNKYSRLAVLNKHVKIIHQGERHQCILCSKTFTSDFTLKKHIMIHAGDRPIQCDICPMNYVNKQDLVRHMRHHENPKFVCKLCKSPFSVKGRFEKHMKLEHTPVLLQVIKTECTQYERSTMKAL